MNYVYLIESERKEGKTYIGSTKNPYNRLRQHNGLIKGGAKKTVKNRPWKAIIVVEGFRKYSSALEFEWAWQHPFLTKSIENKENLSKSNFTRKEKRFEALERLLLSEKWKNYNLRLNVKNSIKVNWVDTRVLEENGDLSEFENKCKQDEDWICGLCLKRGELSSANKSKCYMCLSLFHIKCFAEYMNEFDEIKLVPDKAVCPNCENVCNWEEIWV